MKKVRAAFNKLTLFDKALIIIAILGFAFFAYVFFRKATYISATIKVGEENILYQPWTTETGTRTWFSQLFYKGMKEADGLGRTMAEVVSIRSYDTAPSRKIVYLTLKVKAVYNRASNQNIFKGTPLVIGSPIRLYLDKLLVEGLVTDIEGVKDPREKQTLIVEAQIREETPVFPETSGTKEYIADALKVGDEIKDDQGNIIVKILDKRVEDAKKLVTTASGGVLVQRNPLRRDVYLSLEVNAIKIGGRFYLFDDIPLLVGGEIPLNTPIISVLSEVTKISFPQ